MDLTGKPAPGFTLPTNGGGSVTVPDGQATVLYFYPKDDTPGCTTEALDFTAMADAFAAVGFRIIGVSPDTVARHDRFVAKHTLGITLASDEDKSVCAAYGVWVEKKMYGRTFMGVERSTFLIDGDGLVQQEWRKLRVKGHVAAVLEAAKAASNPA